MFTVRPTTPDDLPVIFAIYNHEVAHGIATFDTEPKSEAHHAAWWAAHPAADYPAFVACDASGSVVGWAALTRWSDRKAYDRTAEVSEYVHHEFRGRGVGTLLLKALIDSARARGRKVLLARVSDANTGSVRYHEKLGFTTVGVMKGVGEKFGRVLDTRIMELQLG